MLAAIRVAASCTESRKVGVSGRGFHLEMAEKAPDHRQALAERQRP